MAKRFFDTELMKKDWFQRLPSVYKCFWYFLISECDCVGVWSVNWRLAEFVLGEPIDKEKAVFYLGEQLDFVSDTKIFIKDFCKFQYGELNENCKPHRKYITVLQEYGLLERVLKGYAKGIHTLQEKEEEKESINSELKEDKSIIYSSQPPQNKSETLELAQCAHKSEKFHDALRLFRNGSKEKGKEIIPSKLIAIFRRLNALPEPVAISWLMNSIGYQDVYAPKVTATKAAGRPSAPPLF